jgi:hypothetical protein
VRLLNKLDLGFCGGLELGAAVMLAGEVFRLSVRLDYLGSWWVETGLLVRGGVFFCFMVDLGLRRWGWGCFYGAGGGCFWITGYEFIFSAIAYI